MSDHAFNGAHHGDFVGRHEGHGVTGRSSPTGAADAVHIVFSLLRHVVVDDVRDAVDVQTALRDISCDQHADASVTKAFECLDALRLRLVGVHGGGSNLVLFEIAHDLVRAVLGACEHEHRIHFRAAQQVHQEIDFLFGRHRIHCMRNRHRCT